jgi:glycosyltransferase involved in cell wall biosynthesis
LAFSFQYAARVNILFITRSWHGKGGLQTLSRDLWQEIHAHYKDDATLCAPAHSGGLSLIPFACHAFFLGLRVGKKGHIHLGDASLCPLGAMIHFFTGAHVSVTVAGLDVIYPAVWYQWLLRRSMTHMHRVCAISHATADEVRSRGVDDARLVVIPCGIHTGSLPIRVPVSHAAPALLSVCRLIPRKGIVWFLDAVLPVLLQEFPTLTYTMIGDGPERSAIEEVIRQKNLGSSVILLGICDDRRLEELYLSSDLLIVPNISIAHDMEGFGIVCLEASARGLPVAAANIEGVADAVLERETGRFFESENAENAVRVMTQMLRLPFQPSDIEQITAMHFDWARLFPQYIDDVFC